jgi:hypothetical protein
MESQQKLMTYQGKVNQHTFLPVEHENKHIPKNPTLQQNITSKKIAHYDQLVTSNTEQETIPHYNYPPVTGMSGEHCDVLLDLFLNDSTPHIGIEEMNTEPPMSFN